jgi:membrane protein
MIRGDGDLTGGTLAGIIGLVTLLLTASGVFGELQTVLNEIWKAPTPPGGALVSRVVRARIASLGLVATTGFLLLVSLLAAPHWRRLSPGPAACCPASRCCSVLRVSSSPS